MDRSGDDARLLAALAAIGAATDLVDFARRTCEELLALVPGVSASYNELNLLSDRIVAYVHPDPGAAWYEQYGELFGRLQHEHPLLGLLEADPDRPALTWDDVDPSGEFRRTDLYRHFYLPNGIHSQAAFVLPAPAGVMIALAVNRDGTPFDDRERRLMTTLRPHLANLHRLHVEHSRSLAGGTVALGDEWTSVVVADDGTVVATTPEAVAAAADADISLEAGSTLVGTPLWPWNPGARERTFTLARVPVHLPSPDGRWSAVLVTQPVGPHTLLIRMARRLTPQRCRDLGLTRRQADVARLLVDGATNQQIAHRLGITTHTVRKHVESVFARLGVTSRARAVAVLLAGVAEPPLP